MSPDPLIVRVPMEESNTYVTSSPQDPLSSDAASDPSEHSDTTAYAETDTMTRTANKVNFQFILRPLKTYATRSRRLSAPYICQQMDPNLRKDPPGTGSLHPITDPSFPLYGPTEVLLGPSVRPKIPYWNREDSMRSPPIRYPFSKPIVCTDRIDDGTI